MPQSPVWIDQNTPERIDELLAQNGLITAGSVKRLSVAGEGNMNVTLRVEFSAEDSQLRTLIVKQSRPFVAKYASIPAPLERTDYETGFYRCIEQCDQLQGMTPQVRAWIPEQHLLVLEDLGHSSDATSLYQGYPQSEVPEEVGALVEWLAKLHELPSDVFNPDDFRNRELRQLNHAHVFEIPFQEPSAINLDDVAPGLGSRTLSVRQSVRLRQLCQELGEIYLADGEHLLHGDFYPGSWLRTADGPRIIDPEFCFAGPPEFDLGVLLGHLQMMGCPEPVKVIQTKYQRADVDWNLVEQFAAVEVMRRLMGVAQLPLTLATDERVQLIELASGVILSAS